MAIQYNVGNGVFVQEALVAEYNIGYGIFLQDTSAEGGGATATTLNGPSSGAVNVASANFNVGVNATPISGTVVVTPATDISGGGTFDPTTISLSAGTHSGSFIFTPAKSGTHTISITNDGGLTDATPLEYAVAPAITVTLVASPSDATPVANQTSLKWAWFDATSPGSFAAPTDKGTTETSDASGVLTIPLPNSTLTNGETGWLVVSSSDGTTTETPPGKSFSGPVDVT